MTVDPSGVAGSNSYGDVHACLLSVVCLSVTRNLNSEYVVAP
jgi:hypothetical protein